MPPSLVILGSDRALGRAAKARGVRRLSQIQLLVEAARSAAAEGRFRPAGPVIVVATSERMVVEAGDLGEALELDWPTRAQAERFTDKLVMKRHLARLAIPHARHAAWPGHVEELIARVGWPVVVKPRVASSGRGKRIVEGRHALAAAFAELEPRFPEGLLVEERFRAREHSVETFVSAGQVVFQSVTEYIAYGEASLVGGAIPKALDRRLRELAARATLGFGLTHGMTHAEFFATEHGPVFSEIAMRPPGGHLMDLIGRAHKLDPWELYLACLIGDARALRVRPRCVAANWILHPPAGILRAIHGEAWVRALPGVVRVKLTKEPGDRIARRTSLGQMTGVVTLQHQDESVVRESLHQARQLLTFKIAAKGRTP